MLRRITRISSIILFLSVAVSATARDFFQPINPPRTFQVMAHRGAMKQAPENTQSSIECAIGSGFEWVEVDVRLTKDHKHVIVHNENVDGVTNGTGLIQDLTLDEVKILDAGSWFAPRFSGEHLLTLKECFDLSRKRINLYLDCKQVDPALLAKEIMDAKMEDQVVAYDDPKNLRIIREVSKGKVAIMAKWHPNFGKEEWLSQVHPDVVEINADEITPEICRWFHEQNVNVQAQVLGKADKPEVWDAMLAAGVDWLQTDCSEDIIVQQFRKNHPKCPVEISHHRGANYYAPENTLPAYEKSILLGADYVEFDIQPSKDGQYFVMHDQKLDRTTSGRGPVNKMDAVDLTPLDAGAWFGKPFLKTRIPTLDETLKCLVGRTKLYVDAKDIPADVLNQKLKACKAIEQSVVYQSPEYLRKLHDINPAIHGLCPLKEAGQIDTLNDTVHPYAFDVDWDILSKELIEKCHALGIKVFSDALGKHERIEEYQHAIEWGIDLIQTDYPLRVIRAIELLSKPE